MPNKQQHLDIPNIFHVIPSFAHGGVPIRISYLMNYFGSKARHIILSTNRDYSCRSRLSKEVNYQIADIGNADQGNIIYRMMSFRKILNEMKPDLLLTYNWGSTEWALANSFHKVCRHFHLESGFGPEEAIATMARRNWFRRLSLRNIDGIIVPSQTLINICKTDWKIPESKILYIPNGVDCEKYASAPQADIIPGFVKQEDVVTIGTMTPLRPEKNLPRLITAFRDMIRNHPDRNFNLIIMGEGNERQSLEKMIKEFELTDQIFLPGNIDEPAYALGWLDIYALSSDTEQMPNSLNQAMAAGLPIVGLDVGDVKFMMNKANKPFIAPAGDDKAFTQALTELALNKALRKSIGLENKIHVKNSFDQSRMYKAYADVWGVVI